jgi:hypothetical protein
VRQQMAPDKSRKQQAGNSLDSISQLLNLFSQLLSPRSRFTGGTFSSACSPRRLLAACPDLGLSLSKPAMHSKWRSKSGTQATARHPREVKSRC